MLKWDGGRHAYRLLGFRDEEAWVADASGNGEASEAGGRDASSSGNDASSGNDTSSDSGSSSGSDASHELAVQPGGAPGLSSWGRLCASRALAARR